MNDLDISRKPPSYARLEMKTKEIGFTMGSDICVGSLLKTLVASKPGGRMLELGTGTGLTLSWMAQGLCDGCSILTIDNDPSVQQVAGEHFSNDSRIEFICDDASAWLLRYTGEKFDLIFADAWPGKYSELEETLALIKVGGFYVIDDMIRQPNWPDGHEDNVTRLITELEARSDFHFTKMSWSSGVMIGVRTC